MQTPATRAGHVTEKVMAAITRKVGKMPTHNYNAIYSAVLGVMDEELATPQTRPRNIYLSQDIVREVLK